MYEVFFFSHCYLVIIANIAGRWIVVRVCIQSVLTLLALFVICITKLRWLLPVWIWISLSALHSCSWGLGWVRFLMDHC